jgi:hypothetical protein
MKDELYILEIERMKECEKDYRTIAAQLALYCSGAIFALRASNKELEEIQIESEIVPDPRGEQAIDDLFNQYLEALRDYPELMAIALKFIQDTHENIHG